MNEQTIFTMKPYLIWNHAFTLYLFCVLLCWHYLIGLGWVQPVQLEIVADVRELSKQLLKRWWFKVVVHLCSASFSRGLGVSGQQKTPPKTPGNSYRLWKMNPNSLGIDVNPWMESHPIQQQQSTNKLQEVYILSRVELSVVENPENAWPGRPKWMLKIR